MFLKRYHVISVHHWTPTAFVATTLKSDWCLSIAKFLAPASVFPFGINIRIATFARVVFADQLSALMNLCPTQYN